MKLLKGVTTKMKKLLFYRFFFLRSLNSKRPGFKTIRILLIILLLSFTEIYSQTTVFSDNFESGTTNWTLQGTWGLVTSKSHSSSHSLSTSTLGNYLDNQNISAALKNGVDLSSYKGAEIEFWGQYNLEQSFDFAYLEISIDGGNNWYQIDSFNGTLNKWTLFKYNIGSFTGNPNVLIRFRLKSDQYVHYTGMYVDDFQIIGSDTDDSAPFISEQNIQFYKGTPGNDTVNAQIFDASGVQSATLYYTINSVDKFSVSPTSINGNIYTFVIPQQTPGSAVSYKIGAVDSSPLNNKTDTSKVVANNYISGTYLSYDNGTVDAVASFTSSKGAAVMMTVPFSKGILLKALIRNYADPNISNNQMLFHVWSDNSGKPGSDLITPFLVTPAATATNPYPMTVIDLSSYSTELSSLTGNFYIGFTVPSGTVNIVNSNTVVGARSFSFNGSTWSSVNNMDYEFRAIVEDGSNLPVELTTFTALSVNSGVELKWATATEVNNYGFEVERKSNNTWDNIAFVPGHGNSNSPKQYSYTDKNLTNGNTFQYRLKQIDNEGTFEYSNTIEVNAVPSRFELSQNFPNPFNPSTTIKYYTPKNSFVTLKVYDMLGREITTLVNEQIASGYHEVNWNGLDSKGESVSSGVYIYRLTAGNFTQTKKMNLLK